MPRLAAFLLEAAKEAFRNCIIPTISQAAHAANKPYAFSRLRYALLAPWVGSSSKCNTLPIYLYCLETKGLIQSDGQKAWCICYYYLRPKEKFMRGNRLLHPDGSVNMGWIAANMPGRSAFFKKGLVN